MRVSTNRNKSTFYSLFFKQPLNDRGGELTFDVSNYHLLGDNASTYTPGELENGSESIKNNSRPRQNAFGIKVDGTVLIGKNMNFNMGAKVKMQDLLVSFKLSYHFNSGKKPEKIDRNQIEIDAPPNKAF